MVHSPHPLYMGQDVVSISKQGYCFLSDSRITWVYFSEVQHKDRLPRTRISTWEFSKESLDRHLATE